MSQPSSSGAGSGVSEYRTERLLTLFRRAEVPNTDLIRVLEAVHEELVDINAHLIDLIEASNVHSELLGILFEDEEFEE